MRHTVKVKVRVGEITCVQHVVVMFSPSWLIVKVLSLLTWRKQVLEREPASNFKQRVWTWQTAFMRKCCVSKRRRRKKRRCLHRTALCVCRLHGNCRRHVSSCLAVWRGQVLWHNWKLLLKNYRDLYIKRLYRFCHSEADKIMETPAAWYDTRSTAYRPAASKVIIRLDQHLPGTASAKNWTLKRSWRQNILHGCISFSYVCKLATECVS